MVNMKRNAHSGSLTYCNNEDQKRKFDHFTCCVVKAVMLQVGLYSNGFSVNQHIEFVLMFCFFTWSLKNMI